MSSVGINAISFRSNCIIAVYFISFCIRAEALSVYRTTKEDVGNVTGMKQSFIGVARNFTKHGYSTTEHVVETEDGYLLTIFRLQRSGGDTKGSPVLMMHGLLQSSSMWIDAGSRVALAYLLADAGHDVWLGNDRGTHYSRRHVWLNPDTDSQYWQFTVTEIGSYDLPAVIDYILSRTGDQKLSYIGFSQGAGSFFIMCSERPEYRDKVNVMIAIAPGARMLNSKSVILSSLFKFYENTADNLNKDGVWEVLPHGGFVQSFSQVFCGLSDAALKVCEMFLEVLDSSNPGSKTKSSLLATFGGFPAGTSVHNMAKYGQALNAQNFQKFDYGPAQNLVHYGSETAPVFNLSLVKVPVVVLHGKNDQLVNKEDINWLVGQLPNVLEVTEVQDPLWTHFDICMSRNIPKFIFPQIEEYLKKFS